MGNMGKKRFILFLRNEMYLQIRTICYARDLWRLAWPCKQLHLLSPTDLWNVPGIALLGGLQSSKGAFKSIEEDST